MLAKLGYDQYRDIRFRRASALWYDHAMFEVQFFHRGFTFDRRVNINEIVGSAVRAVPYNPAMFEFGKLVPPVKLPAELGFAGFRVHYPLNTPAYKDEVLVFLGASYFRLLGRNQLYGLSARGLAVNTATEGGEEFPYFTDFWLVRPEPQQRSLTIYADSRSITQFVFFVLYTFTRSVSCFCARFAAAQNAILVLLPGALAGLATFPVTMTFLMFVRPRFLFTVDCLATPVVCLLYAYAIPRYGALGAAWVTSGSCLTRALVAQVAAWRWVQSKLANQGVPLDWPIAVGEKVL